MDKNRITVRLSAEEMHQLAREADRLGVTRAEAMRLAFRIAVAGGDMKAQIQNLFDSLTSEIDELRTLISSSTHKNRRAFQALTRLTGNPSPQLAGQVESVIQKIFQEEDEK